MKGTIEGLAPINCFYNKQPMENGKCYSTTCMFNQDESITEQIQKEGCTIYKNIVRHGGRMWFEKN